MSLLPVTLSASQPHVPPLDASDRKKSNTKEDEHFEIAQRMAANCKTIETEEDILGVQLDSDPEPEDFPRFLKDFGLVKARKYALQQQKLLHTFEKVNKVECSDESKMIALVESKVGREQDRTNKIYMDLHREKKLLKDKDFCLLELHHARTKRSYQFIYLGNTGLICELGKIVFKLPVQQRFDKFFEIFPKKGVILPEYRSPFKVSNESELESFKKYLNERKFTIIHKCQMPTTFEKALEIILEGRRIFRSIEAQLKDFPATPLMEFLEEQEQKNHHPADSKTETTTSVAIVSYEEFTDDQYIEIGKQLLEEDKTIQSSQSFFDRSKFGYMDSPEALHKTLGDEQFKQYASVHCKRQYALYLMRDLKDYSLGAKLIAITKCNVGECSEKATRIFFKARKMGIKDVVFMTTKQTLQNEGSTLKDIYGHAYVLLGVKKSEVQSILAETNNPIEFLKKLRKGVIVDPFFGFVCKVTNREGWKAHVEYNKVFSINCIVQDEMRFGGDLSKAQAICTMTDGEKIYQEVLKDAKPKGLPGDLLTEYVEALEAEATKNEGTKPKKKKKHKKKAGGAGSSDQKNADQTKAVTK